MSNLIKPTEGRYPVVKYEMVLVVEQDGYLKLENHLWQEEWESSDYLVFPRRDGDHFYKKHMISAYVEGRTILIPAAIWVKKEDQLASSRELRGDTKLIDRDPPGETL